MRPSGQTSVGGYGFHISGLPGHFDRKCGAVRKEAGLKGPARSVGGIREVGTITVLAFRIGHFGYYFLTGGELYRYNDESEKRVADQMVTNAEFRLRARPVLFPEICMDL